jgi:deoxycytidylate deaminase
MDAGAGGWLSPEEIIAQWPYETHDADLDVNMRYRLVTKPEVIHAESNMLGKLAGSHESAKGATIYITCAPCLECAKQLAVAKVKEVIYNEEYRGTEGVNYLLSCNIPVEKYDEE